MRNELPHLSLPLRVQNKQYVQTEQDTDSEATDCVFIICSFPKEWRAEDPDFGIEDPTFETQPIDTDDIAGTIAYYEPRVNVVIETEDTDDGQSSVTISVTLPTSDDLPGEA
jgi:hypothetical protein